MDHERQRSIYASDARGYDALVSAEDCDGNLLPALKAYVPPSGAAALDVGCGTGRLTRLLGAAGADVTAVDRERAMLTVARDRAAGEGLAPAPLAVADASALPFADASFDLATAGWVFGHFLHWMPETWREQVDGSLGEMTRILRPRGALVLLETLGTAVETPAPPNPGLAEYYRRLEDHHGFHRIVIRTDYAFSSTEEAVARCEFFFGKECAARVKARKLARVREFSGLWWRRIGAYRKTLV